MIAIYYEKPEPVMYMPLPDGRADVWLRKNITETKDDMDHVCWTADEVYFRTGLKESEIEERFDELFENTEPEEPEKKDLETRVTEAEQEINSIKEAIERGLTV